MGFTIFLESLTAAASAGMGCGTCCGSGISTALYGYVTTHMKNMKQSVLGFCEFFLGKIIGVILLCITASIVGENIIDETGSVLGVKTILIVDVVMIIMGIWLLVEWIQERKGSKDCKSCGGCSKPAKEKGNNRAVLFGMGLSYGVSPCAPLILITGYAASLPLGYAALLGGIFALSSTISPIMFMLLISGVIAGKMYKEIPNYLTWFRLACYLLLIAVFSVSLFREVNVL